MQVVELRCPHCSTKLRLRDQSFVGRTIHCPDCAQAVTIIRNDAGQIEGRPRESAPPTPTGRRAGGSTPSDSSDSAAPDDESPPSPPPASAPASRWIALGTAAVLGLGVLVLVLTSGQEGTDSAVTIPAEESEAVQPDEHAAAARQADEESQPDESAAGDVTAAADGKRPLETLAEWVVAYQQRHGRFPAENPLARKRPPEQWLGWLAELAAAQEPNGPLPLWDRPIDDPLNSRFVRRRMETFLNPLGQGAAADGFPATHYVGMAGVGPDAAQLPRQHPRAGIFGIDRETTVEDVTDGLSHTLLIVGVAARPVPWVAGGGRTMRPVTQEPYVNGPDGFGTGQPDGMFVALADGSVRFESRDVAGVVWRRMAAMADGLPLDPDHPGEPGDSPVAPAVADATPTPAPPVAAPMHDAGVPREAALMDQPIEPGLAPDRMAPPPPSYDVERALAQPIVRFSQVRGVPFGELLKQLEDLAGVPVQLVDGDDASREAVLTREVSVELRDTTVGEIFDAVLKQVGLRKEAGEEFGIRLLDSGSTP